MSQPAIVGVCLAALGVMAAAQPGRAPVGAPSPTWTDVRAQYGARGDGQSDDTAALQRALDEVGRDGRSPVLYLPAGRYRVRATLGLTAREHVRVLGESPDRVSLVWDGAPGGTMLRVNGVAYSRVSGLSVDGRGRAGVAIDQSWDNRTGTFDTGNEYSDLILRDVAVGIRGGFQGYGFAETSVHRVRFSRNTRAGVSLGNFNALDTWVWDSEFEQCGLGVTNEFGAGEFHVYNSVFRGSTVADLSMQNTGALSARGNVSYGSKAFFVSGAPLNHPAQVTLHANAIIDARDASAIRLASQGPGLLIDNVIVSRPGALAPAITWKSPLGSDVATIGNRFTSLNPIDVNGRWISLDDRTESRAELLSLVEARQPAASYLVTPRPLAETLDASAIDVPPGDSAEATQRAIDRAVQSGRRRPVVHMGAGRHRIDRTLVVPPSDLVLAGDSAHTQLEWTGPGAGPVLRLEGPTRATVRDLEILPGEGADGVVATNLDTPGGRVRLSRTEWRASHESGVRVGALQHTRVEMIDIGHANAAAGPSLDLEGGRTTIFSGASSNNVLSYRVHAGASLLARDIWYEGHVPGGFARIEGAAAFSLEGSRVATPVDGPVPAFEISGDGAQVTLMTTRFDDRVAMESQVRDVRFLALGLLREPVSKRPWLVLPPPPPSLPTPGPPTSPSSPRQRVAAALGRQRLEQQGRLSDGTSRLDDVGEAAAMLLDALSATRGVVRPMPEPADLPSVTDLRFERVWVEGGRTNLALLP